MMRRIKLLVWTSVGVSISLSLPTPLSARVLTAAERSEAYRTDALMVSYVRRGQWEDTFENYREDLVSEPPLPEEKVQAEITSRFRGLRYAWFKPQGGTIGPANFGRRDILAVFLTCRNDRTIAQQYRRYADPAEFDHRRGVARSYDNTTFMCEQSR